MEYKTYLYKGFISVERLETIIKGEKRVLERLEIKDAVTAIVTDAEGKIALVRQFRPCVDEMLYQTPSGLMDKDGYNVRETLIEELYEECDINSEDIEYCSQEPIYTYYGVCDCSDSRMSIYRVKLRSIEHSKSVDDTDVDIVEWLTFSEFEQLARRGEIKDPETLIAYMHLKEEKMLAYFNENMKHEK